MSTSVANTDFSLRRTNNKISTTYTKALTERDLVKKLVEGFLNGANAKYLGRKILNYVYRINEFESYQKIYKQVRLDTEEGEKNIEIVEKFDAFVEDIKSHVCLNKCAKYDKPGQKHVGLDVFKLICLNKLETMNEDWSYSKASFKEKTSLVNKAVNLLDDFYTKFDDIERTYEMNPERRSRIPMEAKMERIDLNHLCSSKPSDTNIETCCEYEYSHGIYVEIREFLIGLEKKVSKIYLA